MAENNTNDIKEKVLVLRESDKHALGTVRCLPALRAAIHEGWIWIRGIPAGDRNDKAILQLPVLHTYLVDEQERLFPAGCLTPVARLQALSWQPLNELLPVELPVSALPGVALQKLEIKLIRSSRQEEAGALMTSLRIWKEYVEAAPLIRLKQLQFAVSEDDQALIIGMPVPPIPGKAYTLRDHILLPAGYDLDPPVVRPLIRSRLNPLEDAWLLFDTDGSWQRIPLQYCMPATRSAARMTKGGRHG